MLTKAITLKGKNGRDRPTAKRTKKQIEDTKRANRLLSIISEMKSNR